MLGVVMVVLPSAFLSMTSLPVTVPLVVVSVVLPSSVSLFSALPISLPGSPVFSFYLEVSSTSPVSVVVAPVVVLSV